MKRKAHGAQEPKHILKYVNVLSTKTMDGGKALPLQKFCNHLKIAQFFGYTAVMLDDACRTSMIIFLVASTICSYGCSIKEPVLSQIVQVEVLTDHIIDVRSYELPKGSFRGVLWPSKNRKTFNIRIVSGNKFIGYNELFYNIQAPLEFSDKTINVTDDWIIEESVLPENRMIYLVRRKDEGKVFRLYMPPRKQHYSFSVLKNDNGDEIVLFMDLSEYVYDNGIFGYVVIRER